MPRIKTSVIALPQFAVVCNDFALHNAEPIGDKCEVGQASIARRIKAGHVVVAVGGCKVNRHSHKVAGDRGSGFVVGVLRRCQKGRIG